MPFPSPQDWSESTGRGTGVDRRQFIRVIGWGAATVMAGSMPSMAGPFETPGFERLIPPDKNLHPDWIKSLFERGSRSTYRGDDLKLIGMPVGGLCAGQLYLGGDGKLWYWDIFNKYYFSGFGGDAYKNPYIPFYPIDQGFALKVITDGKSTEYPLENGGFSDISFTGEYPFGFVEYRDPACPVTVSLEAFSPFTPLSTDDSSLPATVMRYTLRNTSAAPVDVELTGHLENGAAIYSRFIYGAKGTWQNRIARDGGSLRLECGVVAQDAAPVSSPRPVIVFADFEGPDYGSWVTEGDAFGTGPTSESPPPHPPRVTDFQGKSYASSYLAHGGDDRQGKLTSPEFAVERSYVNFLIGGGSKPGKTCMNLLVDGNVVRTSTPIEDTEKMIGQSWDVSEYEGKKARVEIVDHSTGPWGHVEVDQIEFADVSKQPLQKFANTIDFGTMTLSLLQAGPNDSGSADGQTMTVESPVNGAKKLIGSVTRQVTLQPNETHTATFAITWHFPNFGHDMNSTSGFRSSEGRYYATKFADASAVAQYISDNFERLYGQTKGWHDTWYDSTLPYWLLDRTLLNISTLATSTAYRFADGRFYAWEGVGSCAGTCTHVWSYEQCMGRLMPDLDRLLRDKVEFVLGQSLYPDGHICNRSGGGDAATDGQAGTILRGYRDHQTSVDDAFLKRNWTAIKSAIGWLIAQDGNNDGLIEGPQPNTMDETWYGAVPWMSGLYLAALRAGEEMALDLGDTAFAQECRSIFEAGQKNFVQRLWNDEAGYFFQIPDPQYHGLHQGSYDGCEADQVYGQSWGHQVGLGRIIPEKQTKQALASLWKFNFAPDVGPYRQQNGGRWYALPGETGLVICTWPQARDRVDFNYCSECWTGIEHHVAGHMLWEGMILEGLAAERAVHDRYHPSKRNPWNEVECGDHYARAQSSYGVFVAACGFEYHGPRGTMAFAPRLMPENFRAAFTASEGWGSFAQKLIGSVQHANIEVKWGRLALKTLTLTPAKAGFQGAAKATLDGQDVPLLARMEAGRVVIDFRDRIIIATSRKLEVEIS